MTVAAVVVAGDPASALEDAAGRPSARRIAEVGWAGGAVPLVVVVAGDPAGAVALALGGSEATVLEVDRSRASSVGEVVRGIRAAADLLGQTTAALVWPVQFAWVDAETVTSLIQEHGADPTIILRPRWDGRDGWPVLVPLSLLPALTGAAPETAIDVRLAELSSADGRTRSLDLGDPGTVTDRATPMDRLQPYAGPPPPTAPGPEWGAAAADGFDDDQPPVAPLLRRGGGS